MSSSGLLAAALLLFLSVARVARAQSPDGSQETPREPVALVVSEVEPEAEPSHEVVWFAIGGPIFGVGVGAGIAALAHLDFAVGAMVFGVQAAVQLTIGGVLLIIGVVRWVDVDGARARFRERHATTVAFDPTTLSLRW